MKVIIYHHNSFGGTYEHAILLYQAYKKNKDVKEVNLLLPTNAHFKDDNVLQILLPDLINVKYRFIRRLYFVYRSIVNPLIVWNHIRKQKNIAVVFNEFDQLTSFVWVPFFKLTKKPDQVYSVILHDPDRDPYLPSVYWSKATMNRIMTMMDVGFYHELLPDRSYYKQNKKVKYINVSPGVYPKVEKDMETYRGLMENKANFKFISIIGNIRSDKNYHLAIEALKKFPELKLVIAGREASSRMDLEVYKKMAADFGVSDKIIWIHKFLKDEELAAVLEATDYVLLYYSSTFKSQSGVLFLAAPYRKKIIASDGESALALLVKKYKLGITAEPDSITNLENALSSVLDSSNTPAPQWDEFMEFGSWDTNARLSMEAFSSVIKS